MRNGAVVAVVLSSAASSVELDTLPCVPAGRGTLCACWHRRHILCITTWTCLAIVGKSWEKEKSAKESESEKIAFLL